MEINNKFNMKDRVVTSKLGNVVIGTVCGILPIKTYTTLAIDHVQVVSTWLHRLNIPDSNYEDLGYVYMLHSDTPIKGLSFQEYCEYYYQYKENILRTQYNNLPSGHYIFHPECDLRLYNEIFTSLIM